MFDFAWSEMAVIAAVALVLIGPKDMPVAIRSITGMIKKARRMAGEFQTHVDEMLREANLDEVKSTINDIRNFDLKSEMERTVDPDGTLRDTFASNPLEPTPADAALADPAPPDPGHPGPRPASPSSPGRRAGGRRARRRLRPGRHAAPGRGRRVLPRAHPGPGQPGRGDGDAAGLRRAAVEQAAIQLRRQPLARR
jgi:sec-independent protein translocase protein TatB